jgi:two-component system LytT family sensor kinase
MIKTVLITDPEKYKGWTRAGFHLILLAGILLLTISAYLPWFFYPSSALSYPFRMYASPVLRDSICIIFQYYFLVFLFRNYIRKPWYLTGGLVLFYILLFTLYYYLSLAVKQYGSLPDDYSGAITHFENYSYWDALAHPTTFFHLLFIIERAFYPLAIKLLIEIYRRQVRNAKLQEKYVRLELDFLKSQVNPHFLFNVLNSIYSLTEEDNPRAAQIVQQLSVMMRYSLYETSGTFVPLEKELDFIRNYVALEQLRTSKRLTLETHFPKEVNQAVAVAPFILITFVENAFKHGVEATAKKSWVTIDITLNGTELELSVKNSKPVRGKSDNGGLGLANVGKRLALLYPEHELNIRETKEEYAVFLKLTLTAISSDSFENTTGIVGNDKPVVVS